MPRKGQLEVSIWFWISLVVVVLGFILLYSIQQGWQRSIQSNIQIDGGVNAADLNYIHEKDMISMERYYSSGVVIENGI